MIPDVLWRALGAHVSGAWQVRKHLRQGHLLLTLQTARLLLGRCSPLRGRPRLRFGLAAGFGFGAGFSRPRSPSNRARRARPDDPAWCAPAAPRAGGLARRCRRTRRTHARRSPRWGSPATLLQPHRRRSVQSLASPFHQPLSASTGRPITNSGCLRSFARTSSTLSAALLHARFDRRIRQRLTPALGGVLVDGAGRRIDHHSVALPRSLN